MNLKGYHHYADWVLPRLYEMVKARIKVLVKDCPVLSFTSDLWSGPTESFISLTAHDINSQWERIKFLFCVEPFSGSHHFATIGDEVNKMLEKWAIPFQKCHVFLRDKGGNIRLLKPRDTYMQTAAHELNLVVSRAIFEELNISAVLKRYLFAQH